MLFPLSYGGSYFILDTNQILVERHAPATAIYYPATPVELSIQPYHSPKSLSLVFT